MLLCTRTLRVLCAFDDSMCCFTSARAIVLANGLIAIRMIPRHDEDPVSGKMVLKDPLVEVALATA